MIEVTLHSPEQAHQAFATMWLQAKSLLVGGRKQVLTLSDYHEKLSAQQRKYYHGFVLNEIAKQVKVDGRKYNLEIWKSHFRATFLGDKVVTEINPITGIETKRAVRVSSESLNVKEYTLLIEQVTAYAVTELNVNFSMDFDTWLAENVH